MRPFVLPLIFSLLLSACADPPNLPRPKPHDYNEDQQVLGVYRKYAPHLRAEPGVLTTYLTANNNPYWVMVVVKDGDTRNALGSKYGALIDGVSIGFTVATKNRPDEDELGFEEVKKEALPTTWWGQVVYYLKQFQARLGDTAPPVPTL